MNKEGILSARLGRHHLLPQLADEGRYLGLFRLLQPVSTIHNTHPGAPPSLTPRTTFDDRTLTQSLRQSGDLVKGRFLGGGIGYVHRGDFQVYANAFRRPVERFSLYQQLVLAALQSCGPLTPRQIKEETGLLNKEIMPALHRLQEGFLVFEDQSESDWDRPWCLLQEEWPELSLSDDQRDMALRQILTRFLRANVFATLTEIKDWTRVSARLLKTLIASMQAEGEIACVGAGELGVGYILSEDQSQPGVSKRQSVFMLHKADPLVRAHATMLKQLFGDRETLQYLLIDGELKGAVLGHWRIRAHDVEDVLLLLPPAECRRRRDEILSAILPDYPPPHSKILNYCGEPLA